MVHTNLQTVQDIYRSMRSGLTGRITKLTNFTDRSFNYVWTRAFSEEIRELQELALVSELAGFIDYVGGPVTEDDLEELGIDGQISADRVNELMEDDYLDEYVKIVGVTRNEGTAATGSVTFSTQSAQTTIPEGTVVTTPPDNDATRKSFVTTESASTADGVTQVSNVSIQAVEVGADSNVPANTITQISNPPVGVTGVTNPESTTNGEDRESNDELRSRAKSAVSGAGEGGTVEGIKAYIRNNVDGVADGDIIVDEFVQEQPPFVDVIVDGGLDKELLDAIEFSRPAGIKHNLVRPQVVQIGVFADLLGSDIDTSAVSDDITDFLLDFGVSEEFYLDQFIREIMGSDENILNIDFLDTTIERVTNEAFEYDTSVDAALASDGGTFTDETIEANNSQNGDLTLLPASPATGDAYYFGEETIFSEMDLNISTAGAGTWNIVWEYYNGSGWSSLANVTDGTNDFRNSGVNTVSWDIPSDWASRDLDTYDSQYFIRARLDTFSSISTQPLGQEVFITGSGYRLDYTYEDTNGSISIEDQSGITYDEGADFEVIDNTGDTWPETVVWGDGDFPDQSESFFIDYDVTVNGETSEDNEHDTNLIRDEVFTFNENEEDTFTYNNTQQVYKLSFVPFENTVSIQDENSTTFTKDTDWQLTAPQEYATTDTITYSTGTTDYSLSSDIEVDFVSIHDENDNIFVRGTDYTTVDNDGDGFDDTISWDTSNSVPTDGTNFTVVYDAYPRGVRWDTNNSTPPQDDNFTATYDQVMYKTRHEIVETLLGEFDDASGDTYEREVEYDLVDSTRDGEDDAIYFLSNPSTLGAGEEFFFTYITEGDVNFGDREKADPGTITIKSSTP